MLKIKLANGEYIRLNTNQTDYVSYCVFWRGLYGYEYIQLFEDIISNCKGFIDIGANAGLYSLIAAKTGNSIKVVSFDPTEAATFYLKKNLIENEVESIVTSYQLAVSDKEQEITFFKVRNPKYPYLKYNLGGSSGFVEKPAFYSEMRVKTIALDKFMAVNHPDMRIDFVKIDAENAEPLIIKGMRNLIIKNQCIIVCEVTFDRVIDELEKAFNDLGYHFYFHINAKLVRVGSLKQKADFADVRNCFFVPKQKEALISKWT